MEAEGWGRGRGVKAEGDSGRDAVEEEIGQIEDEL